MLQRCPIFRDGNFHVLNPQGAYGANVEFTEHNFARTMTLCLIVGDCINIDECLDGRSLVEVLSRDPFDDLEDFLGD